MMLIFAINYVIDNSPSTCLKNDINPFLNSFLQNVIYPIQIFRVLILIIGNSQPKMFLTLYLLDAFNILFWGYFTIIGIKLFISSVQAACFTNLDSKFMVFSLSLILGLQSAIIFIILILSVLYAFMFLIFAYVRQYLNQQHKEKKKNNLLKSIFRKKFTSTYFKFSQECIICLHNFDS